MFIYFLLMAWTILSSIILSTRLKKRKSIFCVLNLLPMLVMATLRGNSVGTDFQSYINVFNNSVDMFSEYINVVHIEFGYMILNFITYYLTSSEIFFLFVVAFITYGLIVFGFYKSSKNIFISLLPD